MEIYIKRRKNEPFKFMSDSPIVDLKKNPSLFIYSHPYSFV